MKKGRLYGREEIEVIAKSAIGKSLNDILNEEVVTIEDKEANKGGLGQLIEKYLFNDGLHSLGLVLLLKHKIASQDSFVSPVKISFEYKKELFIKIAPKTVNFFSI